MQMILYEKSLSLCILKPKDKVILDNIQKKCYNTDV